MAKEILKDKLIQSFQNFEKTLNGQSQTNWHKKRKEAVQFFEQLDFPTTKHEEWKYTNLNKALKEEYSWNASETSQKISQNYRIDGLSDANELVFINGVFREDLSKVVSPEKEVFIANLKDAYKKQPELIEEYFAEFTNNQEEAFTALNTAFAQNGAFIHIPKNAVVEKAIILYFLTTTEEEAIASQPRNLIIAEQNSRVSIIEKHDTFGKKAAFSNVVSEFVVKTHAKINHYKIQNENPLAYQVNTTQVHQEKESYFTNFTISLQGGVLRNNLNIALDGEHCEANMYGLYMLNGKTHVDNHTAVDHKKPNSYSNELYKGVIDEKATGVFNGKIFVRQDAQKTNAYQQNRNILLADTATVNTKPQLEIWADDVKCSHGATTGSLDKNALFYLRSRGIPEEQAKSLMVLAFAQEIISKIPEENLKNYLENLVNERLSI